MAQERRVLLANGQYITIVQTTGTSSGDVMSQSAVTAALSAKANVSHTHAASDITSGTFGTDRIADGAITKAKLGSDVPISTTSYETVTVSGLTTNGITAAGAEVTIGGDFYRFDSSGVISTQIPYGHIYKVKAYPNKTWLGGYEATFTASTLLRNISVVYVEPNGVFIEATDGMLYTSSNWDSSKTPNSIVVLTDSVKFKMALTQARMVISNDISTPLGGYMFAITSESEAKVDYDGAGNTAKIIRATSSTSYAAGYCNAFTFPDGNTKGFLPSLGQLNLAYQNKDAVVAALSTCGGTAMSSSYWSSTFGGDENGDRVCWGLEWNDGNTFLGFLDGNRNVRPFADY